MHISKLFQSGNWARRRWNDYGVGKPRSLRFLILQIGFLLCACSTETEQNICSAEKLSIAGDLKYLWTLELSGSSALPPLINGDTGVIVDESIDLDSFRLPLSHVKMEDRLVVFNPDDGQVRWVYPPDSPLYEIRGVTMDAAHIGISRQRKPGSGNGVVVLSRRDGSVVREFSMSALDFLVSPKYLFLRDITRTTQIYDIETGGEVKSIRPYTIDAGDQFLLNNDRVYSVYGSEVRIFQVDSMDEVLSARLTRHGLPATEVKKFALYDGNLLTLYGDTGLSLYHLKDAIQELWSVEYRAIDDGLWPPAFLNGSIFLYDGSGALIQVNLSDGTVQNKAAVENAMPISAPVTFKNKIYAIYSDGTLRSFSLPDLDSTIEVTMKDYRYDGRYIGHVYFPGIATVEKDRLVVSFGCPAVHGFQSP